MIARAMAEAFARWLALDCRCRRYARHSSWRGFTPGERSRAWDRLAGAILYGTAWEIAEARDRLVNGPPRTAPADTEVMTAILPACPRNGVAS